MAYLRYVDDFLLFSDSKRELMQWREKILKRLERFRLTLHEESAYPKACHWREFLFSVFKSFLNIRRLKAQEKGMRFAGKCSTCN